MQVLYNIAPFQNIRLFCGLFSLHVKVDLFKLRKSENFWPKGTDAPKFLAKMDVFQSKENWNKSKKNSIHISESSSALQKMAQKQREISSLTLTNMISIEYFEAAKFSKAR